jgi:hypothetical protein
MRIYYAHCIAIYNTHQEKRDLATLRALGFEIFNPNQPRIDQTVRDLKEAKVENYMDVFKGLVSNCQAFAFRALPGGAIPAGVQKELDWAIEMGLPIIELPTLVGRKLSLDDTRQYLAEIGQR